MGRKVNPIGFRLKVNRDWDSRWYAEGTDYVDLLQEDRAIRNYIRKELGTRAGISRVEIERFPNQVVTTIHTMRPGIIIGQKGAAVKKLKDDLKVLTSGKNVRVEVSEITKPDLEATLVAENIVQQLERRIGHSRAMKRAVSQAMRLGAKGIRIEVSGRLAGADMARRELVSEGRVPRNTIRANIDYGFAEALTTFGRIGIKVWIYKGEILQIEDKKRSGENVDTYAAP